MYIDKNQIEASNTYTISVSERNKQKSLSVTSRNKHTEKEPSIEWKNYNFGRFCKSIKINGV